MEFTDWGYEDGLILMYILRNDGAIEFTRMRFGFMVGTLSGGRQDSEDDRADYDLVNDVAYSWDGIPGASPGWVPISPEIQVGYVGVAFLKTPNDSGLTAFEYFSPPGAVRLNNDQSLWDRMEPGRYELGSEEPEDGDFIMGTGDFVVPPYSADTVIAAIVFGEDLFDMQSNVTLFRQLVLDDFQTSASEQRTPAYDWSLAPAYPNPFNSATTLDFTLPRTQTASLTLYDVTGRHVRTLSEQVFAAGSHRVVVDAAGLPTGIYFVHMNSGTQSTVRPITLVR